MVRLEEIRARSRCMVWIDDGEGTAKAVMELQRDLAALLAVVDAAREYQRLDEGFQFDVQTRAWSDADDADERRTGAILALFAALDALEEATT